ncbi:hypothetical protein GY45DRAFT_644467 [Cubamyces sp. BRFM 1775]|nr:hypothetical protein GY45DRAFT_644467 [Cubamyces sp. BRFM 1775]
MGVSGSTHGSRGKGRDRGENAFGLGDRVGPTRTDRAGGGGAGHMITSLGDVGARRRIVGTRGSHCATPISPLAPCSPPNRGVCRASMVLAQFLGSYWQRRHPARPLLARAIRSRTSLSNCTRLGRSAAKLLGADHCCPARGEPPRVTHRQRQRQPAAPDA